MGDRRLAGPDLARSTRALLDDEVGPLLVGLRTLEWRWDRLQGIGIDPDEMLHELAVRAAGARKVADDLAVGAHHPSAVKVAAQAAALHTLVVRTAGARGSSGERSAALTGAVGLATDLHESVEDLWREASRDVSAASPW